jgi:hypothetical protein
MEGQIPPSSCSNFCTTPLIKSKICTSLYKFLPFAFRLSPYAFRLTPFALRLSPYAFRLTPFALRLSPYALRLTPFALRLSPYAFRLTPYALRLSPYAFRLTARRGEARRGEARRGEARRGEEHFPSWMLCEHKIAMALATVRNSLLSHKNAIKKMIPFFDCNLSMKDC